MNKSVITEQGMTTTSTRRSVEGSAAEAEMYDEGSGDNQVHRLDSPYVALIHAEMLGHYHRELDRQAYCRLMMERDEAMYDHDHWEEEHKVILEERGQVPLVFNMVFTAVNWTIGSQRRAPTDYSILPRKKEGLQHAERKTELMKYLSDRNYSASHVTRAFAEVVKAGLSWLETGHQGEDDGPIVYDRFESWRNVIHDSLAQDWDLSDAKFITRTKWVDEDWGVAMFPDRQGTIKLSTTTPYTGYAGSDFGGDSPMDSQEASGDALSGGITHGAPYAQRRRVRLYETWYRKPVEERFMSGGDFSGEIYDEYSPGHNAEIEAGRSSVVAKVKDRMRVIIYSDAGVLFEGPSPYRHNRYPFTPIWGYRRSSDGTPYGMIRGVYDIQVDTNKRASKMMHLLSSTRIFVEEGAVADIDVLREEAHLPNAVIEYKHGKPAPRIETETGLAAAHAQAMDRNIQLIQQTSGVTDQNMGNSNPNASGKAIMALQDQGALTTSNFFDNLRFARRVHGEKLLSNIEQFYTDEMQFRVTNTRGNPEYRTINDDNDEDDNHIGMTKADFIVAEEDANSTHRQSNLKAMTEMIMPIASSNPQFMMNIMDLLVEAMDIPKQEEFVKRIRQITGQADPDADPNNPDEQTIALAQQQQAAQAKQERSETIEFALAEGKAMEASAKARLALAKAADAEGATVASTMEQLKQAIDAATGMIGAEGAGAAADAILNEAIRMAAAKRAEQEAANAPPPQDPSTIPPDANDAMAPPQNLEPV